MLSTHPEVASRMIEELRRVVGGNENHVSWDHIQDLPYCGAVFNESLRLFPPVSANFRICNETCTLPSGLTLPKGCRVALPISAIGRDPKLWDRPEEFLPERWLDKEDPSKPVRRPDEFILPFFWGGPRICLGKDMARLEVISTAHTILTSGLRFHVLPQQNEKIKIGPVQFYECGVLVKLSQQETIC